MVSRVLVTGAAKRLGRAIAMAFAQAGYAVAVHSHRSRKEAEELCRELRDLNGQEHRCYSCDLTASGAVDTLFQQLRADGDQLSVVVNNASVYRRCSLDRLTAGELDADFDINFRVPLQVMQAYRQHFSSGQIVNMLDYRVGSADPQSGGYGLAKKALKDATLAAALAWAPDFRVNALAPGLVLPPPGVPPERMERLIDRIPIRKRTTEEQVGTAAVFLAQMECLNGQILYLDGGLHLLGADATGERCNTVPRIADDEVTPAPGYRLDKQ